MNHGNEYRFFYSNGYRAYKQLSLWNRQDKIAFTGSVFDELRRLFATDDLMSIPNASLQALSGPHGFAYYKMLVVKRGLDVNS